MPIEAFSAKDFRCLADVAFEPDAEFNLIHGPNASGKTSILEAIAYLGRGRSFRGTAPGELIRHGEREFVLYGEVRDRERVVRVGARNGPKGLEVRVDGVSGGGLAALAEALPLQVVDPNVHDLIAGSPDERRRYLDWVAFHVEHGFLDAWRRHKRALRQRNAALRAGASGEALGSWTAELLAAADLVDRGRRAALGRLAPQLGTAIEDLLGSAVTIDYERGWSGDRTLEQAMAAGVARDEQLGSTQHGPHRADLRLVRAEGRARNIVSRGQQKLLACAMILAATATVQGALDRQMVLLLDDPAAELDGYALARLMARVEALGCQVIATSLDAESLQLPAGAAVFHVEQGRLSASG